MNLCFECQCPAKQICDYCPKYFHQICLHKAFALNQSPSHNLPQNHICFYCNLRKSEVCRNCFFPIDSQPKKHSKSQALNSNSQRVNDENISNHRQISANQLTALNQDMEHQTSKPIQIENSPTHNSQHSKTDASMKRSIRCMTCLCIFHRECCRLPRQQQKQLPSEFDSSILKYFDVFVCWYCVKKFGISEQKSMEGREQGHTKFIFRKINHPSPMDWSWIPTNYLKYSERQTGINLYPKMNKSRLIPQWHSKKEAQSCKIQKIIDMRWTKNAQSINGKFPEEYLNQYLQLVGLLLNTGSRYRQKQQGIRECERYGNLSNIWFLVKWQGVPWEYCCWQDETVAMFYPKLVFEFMFHEYLKSKNPKIITNNNIKIIKQSLKQKSHTQKYKETQNVVQQLSDQLLAQFSPLTASIQYLNIDYFSYIPDFKGLSLYSFEEKITQIKELFAQALIQTVVRLQSERSSDNILLEIVEQLQQKQNQWISLIITQKQQLSLWRKVINKLPFSSSLILEEIDERSGTEFLRQHLLESVRFQYLVISWQVYQKLATNKLYSSFWMNMNITNIICDQNADRNGGTLLSRLFSSKKIIIPSIKQLVKLYFKILSQQQAVSLAGQLQISKQKNISSTSKYFQNIQTIVVHEHYQQQPQPQKECEQKTREIQMSQGPTVKIGQINSMVFHEYVLAFGLNSFNKPSDIRSHLIQFTPKYKKEIMEKSDEQFVQHCKLYMKSMKDINSNKPVSNQICQQLFFCPKTQVYQLYKHICNLKVLQSRVKETDLSDIEGTFIVEISEKLLTKPIIAYLILKFIIKYGYGQRPLKRICQLKNWDTKLQEKQYRMIHNKETAIKIFGEYLFISLKRLYSENSNISKVNFVKKCINTCYNLAVEVINRKQME